MSDPREPHQELRYGPPAAPAQGPAARMPAAVWPLIVLLVATVVAAVIGAGTVALASNGSDDGWEALGAFLIGMVLGLVAFAVTYVVGLVLAARRAFRPGSRALPLALSLGLPALMAAVASVLAAVAGAVGADAPPAMGVVALVAALAAAPASFAWAGSRNARRRLAAGVVALTLLLVVITASGVGLARAELARTADRLPLVVFPGGTAAAPFDGWRRDEFGSIMITHDTGSFARQGHRAYLKYFTPHGVVFVTMHTDVGDCAARPLYTCRTSGTLQGNEVRRYERTAEYGSYPGSEAFDVLVFPDGAGVSVNDDDRWTGRLRTTPRQVLGSLVRVDRKAFEQATGAPLRMR